MKKTEKNNLLDPEAAVENYLDTLLQEATSAPSTAPALKKTKTLDKPKQKIVLLPELKTEPDEEKKTKVSTEVKQQISTKQQPTVETAEDAGEKDESSRTHDFPIQCLMFWVNKSQLSIPLLDLGNVQPWVDNMTQIPQASEAFVGLLKYRDQNVKVFDTAYLLTGKKSTCSSEHKHILIFSDGKTAITCDQLGDVVTIEQDEVQWTQSGGFGFFLGTIRQSLAQLLDVKKVLRGMDQQSFV